jgi:tight adherence protein C
MDITVLLVYIPMFLSGALFGYVFWMLRRESAAAPSRLQTSKEAPPAIRLMAPMIHSFARLNRKIENSRFKAYLDSLARKLGMAGRPFGLQPVEFVAIQQIALILTVLMGGAALASIGYLNVLAVLGLAVVGAIFPRFWLSETINARHKAILRALPYNTDLLTLCVEAGLDFMGGLKTVVEQSQPGPLTEEFSQVLQEIKMGKTRREALEDMAARINLQAVTAFVSSLVQADKLGTPLGEALRIQSEQRRTERFQRAEKVAQEAPVKLMFPLLAFIFPAVFIILFGPIILKWVYEGSM